MQNPEKVALFDFCETLVKFQTADRYVLYVCNSIDSKGINRKAKLYNWCRNTGLIGVVSHLFPYASINKRFVLWRLKGADEAVMDNLAEQYYEKQIRPNFIRESVSELVSLKESGYRIIILSGGYDIYLRYFADEYGISDVISSSIAFRNNRCTGLLNGPDCLWGNKIMMLESYCKAKHIEIDKGGSIAFSDSESDLPMLKYVNNRVIVHRLGSRRWYDRKDYTREITWDN